MPIQVLAACALQPCAHAQRVTVGIALDATMVLPLPLLLHSTLGAASECLPMSSFCARPLMTNYVEISMLETEERSDWPDWRVPYIFSFPACA